MRFFVGVHHPNDGWPLSLRGHQVCISANTLRHRSGGIAFVGQYDGWMLDSCAFTQVTLKGGFEQTPDDYARLIRQFGDWPDSGLEVAVSQDWMCESFVLERTGLTVADHQRLTIERFDAILAAGTGRVPLMPVLQGGHRRTTAGTLRPMETASGRAHGSASARSASGRAIRGPSPSSSKGSCGIGRTCACTASA
jgi:hypothetical protein